MNTCEGCPYDQQFGEPCPLVSCIRDAGPKEIAERLEYLRGEIEAERISMGEILELQGLAEHIEAGDVVLLQWAGVPEEQAREEGRI